MENHKYAVTEEETGQRLDAYLAHKSGRSRSLIQEQIKAGRASINGKSVTKPSTPLTLGDEITLSIEERASSSHLEPVAAELDILYEDQHLLLINKPQGLVIHPAVGHRGPTLVHHLLHHLKSPADFLESASLRPGIVHRLDKGTSGVLLIAKDRKTQEALSEQFKSRSVTKIYECIVWGQVHRPGTLKNPIGRDRIHRKKMSSRTTKSRAAETRIEPLTLFSTFTHLQVKPLTGRTHQIRVHLSEFGHSIVGDPLYGKGATAKRLELLSEAIRFQLTQLQHPFLHALSLTFRHPVTGLEMTYSAPRPQLFDDFLRLLGSDQADGI